MLQPFCSTIFAMADARQLPAARTMTKAIEGVDGVAQWVLVYMLIRTQNTFNQKNV